MKNIIYALFIISFNAMGGYLNEPSLDSSNKLYDYNGLPSLDSSNKLYNYNGQPSLDSSYKLNNNPPAVRYAPEPETSNGPRGYSKPRGTQDRYKTDRW